MKLVSRIAHGARVIYTRISKGGQITVPAPVRKRWDTTRVVVEDLGDHLVIRPIPEDPIGAVIGSLDFGDLTTDQIREEERRAEEEIEDRKFRKHGR